MKKLIIVLFVAASLSSCAKEDFAPEKPKIVKHPDVLPPAPGVEFHYLPGKN